MISIRDWIKTGGSGYGVLRDFDVHAALEKVKRAIEEFAEGMSF
ncbi:hypothetical protein [Geoglobus ahangari]|nr:hypothetical protein [Geoglobus ahangari]